VGGVGPVPEWTIGERMPKARREAGLNRVTIAALLEVSPSAVSTWERSDRQPQQALDRLQAWANVTGVSLIWSVAGDDAT
jgi:transcriptional regulator with XRE-family HTH domain